MNCTECQMITYRLFERSVEKGHRETWGKRHAVDSREGKRRVSSGSRPLGIRRTSLKPSEVLLSNVGAEAPTPCLFPSQFPVALPRSLFPADVHSLIELSSESGGESGGARMAGQSRRSIHMSSSRRRAGTGEKSLAGTVAVVAGATRGAGRGIARALGEAGATVYCTGRSVRGNRSPYNRPETVEETAEMIGTAFQLLGTRA
jgi:hypothetical protein